MEKNYLKSLLYLFILSLVACHPEGSSVKELQMARSMMEEHPDTALYILERIALTDEMGEEEYATYCLLRVKAQEMNGVRHTSDSGITAAVTFFTRQDKPLQTGQSLYLQGRVYEDMGKDSLAESAYRRALTYTERIKEYRMTERVYTRLSSLCYSQQRYDEAFDMQKLAYNNRLLADNEKNNPSWLWMALPVLIGLALLLSIRHYRKRCVEQREFVVKQERQLATSKQVIAEQKFELAELRKEVKSMKRSLYECSEIVAKVRHVNTLSLTSKEKPVLTELEWGAFLNVLDDTFGFPTYLNQHYPKLSDIDIRICALLREGILSVHIASLMGMTPETLTKRMQRIKNEKMGMGGQNSSLELILRGMCV